MSLSLSQAKAFKCTTEGITKRLHDSTGRRKPKSQFFHFSVHKCIVSIVTNNFDLKDNFWWFHDNLYYWWRFSWSFFCYFVMWCHHVLGRHWSFPFSGFWKVGTLQMETVRFYTAGNQNILIRIRYNSLGCGACYMKLKKLTQESNAVFQKQSYYFSSKQLLWEGFIGLIT